MTESELIPLAKEIALKVNYKRKIDWSLRKMRWSLGRARRGYKYWGQGKVRREPNNITLAKRLVDLPKTGVELVILHELAHLKVAPLHGHPPKFKQQYCRYVKKYFGADLNPKRVTACYDHQVVKEVDKQISK